MSTYAEISTEQRSKAKSLFDKGSALECEGKHLEAMECYRAAFKTDPELERRLLAAFDDDEDDQQEKKEGHNNYDRKELEKRFMTVERTPPECFTTFDAQKLISSCPEERSATRARVSEYLEREGYVVLDNCLTQDELDHSLKLFGDFLISAINASPDVLNNPKQILASRISNPANGITAKYGAGASSFSWFLRSRETVKESFRSVNFPNNYDEKKKMITSFDGMAFLINNEAYPEGGGVDRSWLHTDATGFICANYHQGLVNLLDVSDSTEPSFVVFPKSHRTIFPKILPGPGNDPKESGSGIHFLTLSDLKEMVNLGITEHPFRVPLKGGSLVIWKSSTIHCSIGVDEANMRPVEKRDPTQIFRRIVSYICMMEDPLDEEITAHRRELFERAVSTGHVPNYPTVSSGPGSQEMIENGLVINDATRLPVGAAELL